MAPAGSDVRTTQMVRVAGSAHATVPVDPVWPKVCSEQPLLPANKPTFHPSPRGVSPGELWLLLISFAVSRFKHTPFAPRTSARNLAMSGAEACVPPQGAPRLRHQTLF